MVIPNKNIFNNIKRNSNYKLLLILPKKFLLLKFQKIKLKKLYTMIVKLIRLKSTKLPKHKLIELFGHKDEVRHIKFSPNNMYLATASDDNTIIIYSIDPFDEKNFGLEVMQLCYHTKTVNDVQFSQDGKYLLSGGADKIAIVYNLSYVSDYFSKKEKLIGHTIFNLYNEESIITTTCFSHNSKYCATAGYYFESCVYNIINQKVMIRCDHDSTVRAIRFSPTDSYFVTAGDSCEATFYSFKTSNKSMFGRIMFKLNFDSEIVDFCFSPYEDYIALGCWNKSTYVYRLNLQNEYKIKVLSHEKIGTVLKGHYGHINSVNFSPNGNYLVTSSNDCCSLFREFSLFESFWIVKRTFKVIGNFGGIKSADISNSGEFFAISGINSVIIYC